MRCLRPALSRLAFGARASVRRSASRGRPGRLAATAAPLAAESVRPRSLRPVRGRRSPPRSPGRSPPPERRRSPSPSRSPRWLPRRVPPLGLAEQRGGDATLLTRSRPGSRAVPARAGPSAGRHRHDGDAVDVDLGLDLEHVADLGAVGNKCRGELALRLAGAWRRATSSCRRHVGWSARPRDAAKHRTSTLVDLERRPKARKSAAERSSPSATIT